MTPETSHLERLEAVCRKVKRHCNGKNYVDACATVANYETKERSAYPTDWAVLHLRALFSQKRLVDCAQNMSTLERTLTKTSGIYHLPQSLEELNAYDVDQQIEKDIQTWRTTLEITMHRHLHQEDAEQLPTLVHGWHAADTLLRRLQSPRVREEMEEKLLHKGNRDEEALQRHIDLLNRTEAAMDYAHMSVFLEEEDPQRLGQIVIDQNAKESADELETTVRGLSPSLQLDRAMLLYVDKPSLRMAKNIRCGMMELYARHYRTLTAKEPNVEANRSVVFPFVHQAITAAVGKLHLHRTGQLAD